MIYDLKKTIEYIEKKEDVEIDMKENHIILSYKYNENHGNLCDFGIYKNYIETGNKELLYQTELYEPFLKYCFDNDCIVLLDRFDIFEDDDKIKIVFGYSRYDKNTFTQEDLFLSKEMVFDFKTNEIYYDNVIFNPYDRNIMTFDEKEFCASKEFDCFVYYQMCEISSEVCLIVYNLIIDKYKEYNIDILNNFKIEEDKDDGFVLKNTKKALVKKDLESILQASIITMQTCPYVKLETICDTFYYKNFTINNRYTFSFDDLAFFKTSPSIEEILKRFNIKNTKATRKLIIKKLDNIWLIKYLDSLNFTGNYMLFIEENKILHNNAFIHNKKQYRFDIMKVLTNLYKPKDVYKKLVIRRNSVFSKYKEVGSTINDINNMVNEIINKKLDFDLKSINLNQNLHNIEQQVIDIHFKYCVENTPIKYSANEKNYSHTKDNYIFYLPAGTKILRLIGKRMKICVGSYGEAILENRKKIVFIKDITKNKNVGCLEFDNNFKKLVQAKGSCNQILSEPIQSMVAEYCRLKNIKIKTSDLKIA